MSNILINDLRNVICYRNFQYVCGIHVSNKMKWSIFSAPPSIYMGKKYNMHNRSNNNINITCTDILYSTCNWENVNSDILHLVNWYVVNCGLGNFSIIAVNATSSSAVAKRPRDASCLYTKRRAQSYY